MKGELKDPRKTFGKAVSDIAENDERIYVLSADSGGSSGFKEFAAAHPDRYFEFGIMEQGVTGIASGMATTGKIPVFCAIAQNTGIFPVVAMPDAIPVTPCSMMPNSK